MLGLRPKRPVVRAEVQHMQHVDLELIYSCWVDCEFRHVIRAEIAIFENGGQPWRPVGQLLDLNWFLHDDAVGSNPCPAAYSKFDRLAIPGVADVRLRIHGEGRFLPGIQLELNHRVQRALSCGKVWERAW